jgi:hypothetical protein
LSEPSALVSKNSKNDVHPLSNSSPIHQEFIGLCFSDGSRAHPCVLREGQSRHEGRKDHSLLSLLTRTGIYRFANEAIHPLRGGQMPNNGIKVCVGKDLVRNLY